MEQKNIKSTAIGNPAGSNFPDGMSYRGKAHQQLVTDKDGNAQWKDQLAYSELTEVSWEGNTTGRVNIGSFYKVSDLTPSKEDIIGGTYAYNEEIISITQDLIISFNDNGLGISRYEHAEGPDIIVSFVDNLDINGYLFPEKGIYMCHVGDAYANSLAYDKIKQVDKKFLPSAYIQSLNAIFIQHENGNKSSITCNLTYEQIREQIENDLPIVAIYKLSEGGERFLILHYEFGKDYIAFFIVADYSDGFEYHSDGTFGGLIES